MKAKNTISIKSGAELRILREAGAILAQIIEELICSLRSGVKTKEIDRLAQEIIARRQVIPAFKGYRGFPGCVCISVNEEIVHGIPGNRILKEGDLVSLDVGIIYQGYFSDTAVTVPVGKVSPEIEELVKITHESLLEGINQAWPGNHLSDISNAIQTFVEANNFSIVREFVGHGIGKNLHEDPEIPNFGPPHQGPLLKEGMVLAIEPMVNLGGWATKILDDGWTVVTEDGKASAHFEHTIAVTEKGPEVLTKIKN